MNNERRWRLAASAFLFLTTTAVGCSGPKGTSSEGQNTPVSPASLDVPRVAPSMDSDLMLRMLDGTIDLRRRQLARPGINWFTEHQLASQLVIALLTRGHFLSTLGDYDEALVWARKISARHGRRTPRSRVFEARVLASLHRFDEAITVLDAVAAAGVPESEIRAHRATIALARGDARAAIDLLLPHVKRGGEVGDVTNLAMALADLGRIEVADETFRQALSGRLKADPMVVARVWFHQGLMWERQDQPALARRYYLLALERFGHYAPLVSHLAGLEARAGQRDTAIARLRAAITRSQDPDHLGQLAALLEEAGDAREAGELRARADRGYVALLELHPLAFADHAARYYLETKRADRALELAALNLANRESDEALALYLDAAAKQALATGEVCEVAERATRRDGASAYLLFVASRALTRCGATREASAAMAAARRAPRAR